MAAAAGGQVVTATHSGINYPRLVGKFRRVTPAKDDKDCSHANEKYWPWGFKKSSQAQ